MVTLLLCLIRHAPTKENLEKRYLGWTDAPLADTAKLAVVDALVKRYMAVIYSAVDKRSAHYFPNASYQAEASLRDELWCIRRENL